MSMVLVKPNINLIQESKIYRINFLNKQLIIYYARSQIEMKKFLSLEGEEKLRFRKL